MAENSINITENQAESTAIHTKPRKKDTLVDKLIYSNNKMSKLAHTRLRTVCVRACTDLYEN